MNGTLKPTSTIKYFLHIIIIFIDDENAASKCTIFCAKMDGKVLMEMESDSENKNYPKMANVDHKIHDANVVSLINLPHKNKSIEIHDWLFIYVDRGPYPEYSLFIKLSASAAAGSCCHCCNASR